MIMRRDDCHHLWRLIVTIRSQRKGYRERRRTESDRALESYIPWSIISRLDVCPVHLALTSKCPRIHFRVFPQAMLNH